MAVIPPISVIVPMYNAEATIAAALASIRQQTRGPQEVLVIDNGSTDRSIVRAVPSDPAVQVIQERKRGPAAARNTGIGQACGEYVAFLDADDYMPPDRLERQALELDQAPEVDLVFGRQYLFTTGEDPWRQPADELAPGRFRSGQVVGAMMCRRSVFGRAGLFDETLSAGEFIEWFARARDEGATFSLPHDLVLFRRVHSSNLTRDRSTTQQAYAKALLQVIRRRRGTRHGG